MARYERNSVGSLLAAGEGSGGGFRLWPMFSAASFRRRIIDALMCGVSSQRKKDSPATRKFGSARRPEKPRQQAIPPEKQPPLPPPSRSDRLSELLKAEEGSESESDDGDAAEEAEMETRRKVKALEELQGVASRLQCGDEDERKEAATDVRRLAKDDPDARETLATLGAIPPLVGMLDSGNLGVQIASLYALLNLGIGNDMNKAAILKAGAVHKMLGLIESGCPTSASDAIVANFLGLSALDANKSIIGSSGAIPFLVKAFQTTPTNATTTPDSSPSHSQSQARQDALRALFNLSIAPCNAPFLCDSGLVPFLLASLGDMEVSERVLSVLSNVVSASEGRRAVSRSADAFPILIDALNWTDSPGCQEKAAYVLMVMAHKASRGDRAAMIEAGIVSSLLELTLIGTALAQKRASRILECLRVDKGKQVSEVFDGGNGGCSGLPAVSAPLYRVGKGREEEGDEGEDEDGGHVISEERKAVEQLVQQSLQNNMRRIVKRANLPQDFAPSDHFKSLTATSTSKSLPF